MDGRADILLDVRFVNQIDKGVFTMRTGSLRCLISIESVVTVRTYKMVLLYPNGAGVAKELVGRGCHEA